MIKDNQLEGEAGWSHHYIVSKPSGVMFILCEIDYLTRFLIKICNKNLLYDANIYEKWRD